MISVTTKMTTLSPEQLSSESYQAISDLFKIFDRWFGGPDTHKFPQLLELKGFNLSGLIPPLIYSRVRDLSLFHAFIGYYSPYQIKEFDFIFGFSRRSMNRFNGSQSPIHIRFSMDLKNPDLCIMGEAVASLEIDLMKFFSKLPLERRPHRIAIVYDRTIRVSPDTYMSSSKI
nr:hypothetical protein [Nelson Narna-like virus 1]